METKIDWKWYVIALLTLLTVVIGCLAWFYPRNPSFSKLDIGLVSSSNLVNIGNQINKNDLSFYYKENQVKNLRYLKFSITNNGTIPIENTDVRENLKFIFPEKIRLISSSVVRPGMINVSNDESSLVLDLQLLNPTESVDVELLFDSPLELDIKMVKISGRIKNIPSLEIKDFRAEETTNPDLFGDVFCPRNKSNAK